MLHRTIAIGDIHGCSRALRALRALLDAIRPGPRDTVVTLGDYVDKGEDSRGVLDLLIDLRKRTRLVPLLGNHDEMMRAVRRHPKNLSAWLDVGGDKTLDSYGVDDLAGVPDSHWRFLDSCGLYFETPSHFFVHANYDPDRPLDRQPRRRLLCASIRDRLPAPHRSGKIAVVGHTPSKSGKVLDLHHLKCLDTYCWNGGWLSAIEVGTGALWQASRSGTLKRARAA